MQVWVKPHITMPSGSTLWGALGYKRGGENLEQVMLKMKQRQEEAAHEAQRAEEQVCATQSPSRHVTLFLNQYA